MGLLLPPGTEGKGRFKLLVFLGGGRAGASVVVAAFAGFGRSHIDAPVSVL